MKNTIPLTPVESSQIAAVGYDEEKNILAVQFKNGVATGVVYHYDGVSPEKYAGLTGAESLGSYFFKSIKPEHAFTKIVPDEDGVD